MRVTLPLLLTLLTITAAADRAPAYFQDAFDGAVLHPRWTSDNSPANPAGSNISPVAGQALGANSYQNRYNHLETTIDTSGDFAVQIDLRGDSTGYWSPSLVVHWDATHFIALKAIKAAPFRADIYNGSTFSMTNSSLTYPGNQLCTLRIEFTADAIQFFAKNQSDPQLTHLANLDRLRNPWTTAPAALLIVGKGFQSNAYPNPDYDNDYPYSPGSLDQLILDNAFYERLGSWCGNPDTVFLSADQNRDCYVDLRDVADLAGQWLACSDPADPWCDQFWQDDLRLWQIDPYLNFLSTWTPSPQNPPLRQIQVQLARNEYRGFAFMAGPYESGDRFLEFTLELPPALPPDMITINESLYLLNQQSQYTGDAIYPPYGGIVHIPSGQSRQIWLRFDARYCPVTPGDYPFALVVNDIDSQQQQVIPGHVQVWDFQLPSYDVLPNNAYVEFPNSQFYMGVPFTNAVKDMKQNGINMVFLHNVEMPKAPQVDDYGNILVFDSAAFEYRVATAVQTWNQAPGPDKLMWVLHFGDITLGMNRTDIVYPSPLWRTVFSNWLTRTKNILASNGLTENDWWMVLGDEEDSARLMDYTIPLAETIKSIDPSVQLTCNSSAYLIYPTWRQRYENAFDSFQPHIAYEPDPSVNSIENKPQLRDWLLTLPAQGKQIWSYRCCPGYLNNLNPPELYNFYRAYGWRTVKYNLTGIGIWTYNAQGFNPWSSTPNFGYILAYKHWSTDDIVHSRRYEMYREAMDDYRYIVKLREVAAQIGGDAPAQAELLIQNALDDIFANLADHTRCDTWRIIVAEEILRLLYSLPPSAYFIDSFDGAALDPRWHEDNSPSNPPGSNFVVSSGLASSTTNLQEAYHHLETPIDTTANFTVQAQLRSSSGMGTGAPHLVVYWDENHFVGWEAGRGSNCSRESYDGSNFTVVQSTKYSAGWDYFNMRIEFTTDTLKFSIADWYDVPSYVPVYHPELDMARQPWMTGPALMIIGKADQFNTYTGALYENPDFDNDSYGGVYAADGQFIDHASYQPIVSYDCGDPGTRYLQGDLNQDCLIDVTDIARFAEQWLTCTDPANSACDVFWR